MCRPSKTSAPRHLARCSAPSVWRSSDRPESTVPWSGRWSRTPPAVLLPLRGRADIEETAARLFRTGLLRPVPDDGHRDEMRQVTGHAAQFHGTLRARHVGHPKGLGTGG